MLRIAIAGSALFAACAASWASPIYVVDPNAYDGAPNKQVTAGPLGVRNTFEGTLVTLGTLLREDMELMTVAPNTNNNLSPIAYSFGTMTGNFIFPSNETVSGTSTGVFNTTTGGSKFIDSSGSVTISFTEALSGFGLYVTDIGDFSNSDITVQLVTSAGVKLPEETLKRGGSDGGLLFWGFYDLAPNAYYSSVIITSNNSGDVFGLDDFVGVIAPRVTEVPTPATAALLLAAMAGGLATRRRQR